VSVNDEEKVTFYNDLAMGGLLHDIGKLVQRATKERRNHMDIGADWLKELGPPWDQYSWAARFHHTDSRASVRLEHLDEEPKALAAAIISHADSLSASEREETTGQWNADIPLWNVFDRVALADSPAKKTPQTFFPVSPLDDEGLILPREKTGRSMEFSYTALESGLKDLMGKNNEGLSRGPGWLLRALERYTALVPSETAVGEERYPDISLFDHLRTTAMIAVCLGGVVEERHPDLLSGKDPMKIFSDLSKKLRNKDENPFLLVEGDIRGIQQYIYDIGGKKALRGLRARSFYLEAVQESILSDLLETLRLPRTQVLFVGGGHWIVVVPNTQEVTTRLAEFRDDLNRRLFHQEDGRLSLTLAWVPFGWENLGQNSVNEVFREMAEHIAAERCQPMKALLGEVLGSRNDDYLGKSCSVCGKRTDTLKPLDPEEEGEGTACEHCWSLIRLARRITDPSARYLYACSKEKKMDGLASILGIPHNVAENVKDIPQDALRVLVLKQPHGGIGNEDDRFIPMPWAGYAWDNEIEKVLQDGCIGAHKLGALRMDVDNLGRIFAEGLSAGGSKNLYSLSRVATLSRLLTHFFKVNVPLIAANPDKRFVKGSPEGPRRIIIVYSGGDDLFAIGAWNEVAEFAIDIADRFRQFTGDNPSVSISGGMVMADDKSPVYQLAELAGLAEGDAKGHEVGGCKKDSLSFFYGEESQLRNAPGRAFNTRRELEKLTDRVNRFLEGSKVRHVKSADGEKLSVELNVERAFFRRIMELEEMARRGEPFWKVHAAYAAGRIAKGREGLQKETYAEMESAADDTLRTLRIVAEWLDYLIR
jgi:CRISPR-associated protein Csm1